ncbi:hypothetical protein [Alkalimarinus coralli]|uniref:hypothetical protein n=1 Tax=Alkalimarinus coralli TaxID=2935863 RepID=UPI00202B6F4D|nr:hypothetical protein [Alkalimarinus coralli]
MNRIVPITLISALLSGCPVTFNAMLKNGSSNEIVFIPPFETTFNWRIASGGTEKVNWYQGCITIENENGIQYFSGWPIPNNVVTNGWFSSSLDTIYKDNELFFKTHDGKLIKINELNSCN